MVHRQGQRSKRGEREREFADSSSFSLSIFGYLCAGPFQSEKKKKVSIACQWPKLLQCSISCSPACA